MIKVLCRMILCVILSVNLLSNYDIALAQDDGGGTNPPLGTGDRGWCTFVVSLPRDMRSQCGFASPSAACAFQINTVYPRGRFTPTGARITSARTADCLSYETRGTGELDIGIVGASRSCERGFRLIGGRCHAIPAAAGCTKCDTTGRSPNIARGNPVNVLNGAKTEAITDFATADGRMVVKRYYNSIPFGELTARTPASRILGTNWGLSTHPSMITGRHYPAGAQHTFLAPDGAGGFFSARFGVGKAVFNSSTPLLGGGTEEYNPTIPAYETSVGIDLRQPTVFKIEKNDGTVYNFLTPEFTRRFGPSLVPTLTSVDFPGDYSHIYSYREDGHVESITDSFGRTITFDYQMISWTKLDASGRVIERIFDRQDGDGGRPEEVGAASRITFPDGSYMVYEYDAISAFEREWNVPQRLISATRFNADDTLDDVERYHYEDARFPYALTGITDAKNIRYATWRYDEYGRAISSEHAGGIDKTLIDHGPPAEHNGSETTRMVTNPLGKTELYEIDDAYWSRVNSITRNASANVPEDVENYDYTARRDPVLNGMTDTEGRRHSYTRDLRGRITSMTKAIGRPEEVTITTDWHPLYRLPTRRVQPGLTTQYNIDDEGRVTSMTQTDTSSVAAAPRRWDYSYEGPNLIAIDGPLPGGSDRQSFT